jgi:hypothetical protein
VASKNTPPPETDVFINVPFDSQYEPLMRAIVFAVYDCGFVPRCAAELEDGAETRLRKVCGLIEQSRLGIHDISRVQLDPKNKLPRFNMPFELGIFLGIKRLGADHADKSCLILDEKPYRYQKCLSDISGLDISVHKGSPRQAVIIVRNWLGQFTTETIPGGNMIWSDYRKFSARIPLLCKKLGFGPKTLIYRNYVELVSAWLNEVSPPNA